ncbi:hypothetical protein [Providencia rettgeri]|uniref:hypothetical protein n=1 Tax=Providencia rettgeri TaxID=587 RepID=UPI002573B8C4|nr:hypothetical protein [Providencia rettgeri]MDL9989510.1 hypothetical protein [Providencia rettgeri]
MEFKGTPAPWNIDNLITVAINSGYKHVAVVNLSDKVNKDESNANAHLIATAPELLEQLIRLRNKIVSYKPDDDDDLDIVDAVIAKALGQQ